MEEVYDRQKMQEDMQRSSEFVDVFSKVVSGKSGYKTKKCKGCGIELHQTQRFCHECGTKNEVQA